MVYAVRIHREGNYGTTTQVVSLHRTLDGARKALVARLEAIASERYEGTYRLLAVWCSGPRQGWRRVAEVKEVDSFNIVRGYTDWSGDIHAMPVEP